MKKIIPSLILIISMIACNQIGNMTEQEKIVIKSGNAETPFRVLQTDNIDDSLFLRKRCIDIENVKEINSNKEWQYFIQRMRVTLAGESGVGLASPQVGIGRNLFLFMRMDKPGHPVQIAMNPRIIKYSDETFCFENDGCLSIPGLSGNTRRHIWIDVAYYDEKGTFVEERLNGGERGGDYTGIIFQHEFDHLQGILFTDRLYDGAASLHRE